MVLSPDHGDVIIANPLTASLSNRAKSSPFILNQVPPSGLDLYMPAAVSTIGKTLVSNLVADLIVGKETTGPGEFSSLASARCWSIQTLVGSC